jgi:hypothetical protein
LIAFAETPRPPQCNTHARPPQCNTHAITRPVLLHNSSLSVIQTASAA